MMEEKEILETLRRVRLMALRQKDVGLVAKADKAAKILRTEVQVSNKQSEIYSFAAASGRLGI